METIDMFTENTSRCTLPDDVAVKLTEARHRAGIALREAARRIGTSQGASSLYEHGHRCPSVTMAHLIADVYRLDHDERTELPSHSTDAHGRDWPGCTL